MNDAGRRTVLFITPGGVDAPGGIARMVSYCTRAWPSQSPFSLRVVDSYGPGRKILMPFYALRALVYTFAQLLTGRVCLLHINFSERLSLWRKGIFVLLANGFRIPVILHLHGAEFADYIHACGPVRKHLATRLLRRAQKVIVLGSYWRAFVTNEMGIDPARVTILCNAVPDTGARKTGVLSGECRIMFLGVLGERKGVSVLLHALAQPDMASLRWKMIVAGNGPAEGYKAQAQALGIAARVEFPGLLAEEEARAALEAADIFVLPSRLEGLPMAILEAFSHGCPVVATPVGSIPDAVIDGQTGLLVPVGDAAALGAGLARLVRDAALRQQLGAQARALFEQKFALAAYNTALEGIYREVIQQETR